MTSKKDTRPVVSKDTFNFVMKDSTLSFDENLRILLGLRTLSATDFALMQLKKNEKSTP